MAKQTRKAKNLKIRSADEIAADLAEVRSRLAVDKVLNETLTKEFKIALGIEGINHAGNYHLDKSTAFRVIADDLALPFALQRNLVKVDVSKVHDVFRRDAELRFKDPSEFGFESYEIVKVNPVRGSKDSDE